MILGSRSKQCVNSTAWAGTAQSATAAAISPSADRRMRGGRASAVSLLGRCFRCRRLGRLRLLLEARRRVALEGERLAVELHRVVLRLLEHGDDVVDAEGVGELEGDADLALAADLLVL